MKLDPEAYAAEMAAQLRRIQTGLTQQAPPQIIPDGNMAWVPPEKEALHLLEQRQKGCLRTKADLERQLDRLAHEVAGACAERVDLDKRIAHLGLTIEALKGKS